MISFCRTRSDDKENFIGTTSYLGMRLKSKSKLCTRIWKKFSNIYCIFLLLFRLFHILWQNCAQSCTILSVFKSTACYLLIFYIRIRAQRGLTEKEIRTMKRDITKYYRRFTSLRFDPPPFHIKQTFHIKNTW